MNEADTSWANMKKFLGSPTVKEEIINFDARTVSPEQRAKVGHTCAVTSCQSCDCALYVYTSYVLWISCLS